MAIDVWESEGGRVVEFYDNPDSIEVLQKLVREQEMQIYIMKNLVMSCADKLATVSEHLGRLAEKREVRK